MLKLHVLASGSKGNAAIVENAATGAGVLIDCGICKRDFLEHCDEAGFDPTRLEAVFITHEHGDHTKGLGVVLRGLAKFGCAPMVYVNRACVDNSSTLQKIAGNFETAPLGAALALSQDENASEGRNKASVCDERVVCRRLTRAPLRHQPRRRRFIRLSRRVARRRRAGIHNRFGHRDERRARGFARRAHFGAREQS